MGTSIQHGFITAVSKKSALAGRDDTATMLKLVVSIYNYAKFTFYDE